MRSRKEWQVGDLPHLAHSQAGEREILLRAVQLAEGKAGEREVSSKAAEPSRSRRKNSRHPESLRHSVYKT
jgi:hypothetical protein